MSATYRCECMVWGVKEPRQERRRWRQESFRAVPALVLVTPLCRLSLAPFLTVESLVQKGKGLQKRPRGVWLGTRWAHTYGAG